jgi:hypothetical protein
MAPVAQVELLFADTDEFEGKATRKLVFAQSLQDAQNEAERQEMEWLLGRQRELQVARAERSSSSLTASHPVVPAVPFPPAAVVLPVAVAFPSAAVAFPSAAPGPRRKRRATTQRPDFDSWAGFPQTETVDAPLLETYECNPLVYDSTPGSPLDSLESSDSESYI